FSLHMDTLKTISNQAGRWVPLFILTSRFNHDYIVDFYKLHHYFGYP
ncbi:MAG TPA: UDP-N-acetylglucosamine pyrophosphorylase, partial [Clostridiales bacterium]|nr:UDP-N-acetylglucosamine pyrophosphorylase [Clostridiales bacterium]